MKNLARLSFWTAFSGLILIIAGGLVTSHEAGLSVPDWPLSYGQWMPPMIGKIFWEHGHRMIAATVGFLTLVTMIVTLREPAASRPLKKFSIFLLGLVILQGVLGGVTVLRNLPHFTSITHAVLGQIFFSSLCAFAYAVKYETDAAVFLIPDEKKPLLAKAFRIARVTLFIFLLQLIFGAMVRHMGGPHATWTHTIFALVVIAHAVIIFLRVAHLELTDKAPFKTALFLVVALFLQILLGVGSLALTQFMARSYGPSTAEILVTTFHQSFGALLLATLAVLTVMLKKRMEASRAALGS